MNRKSNYTKTIINLQAKREENRIEEARICSVIDCNSDSGCRRMKKGTWSTCYIYISIQIQKSRNKAVMKRKLGREKKNKKSSETQFRG